MFWCCSCTQLNGMVTARLPFEQACLKPLGPQSPEQCLLKPCSFMVAMQPAGSGPVMHACKDLNLSNHEAHGILPHQHGAATSWCTWAMGWQSCRWPDFHLVCGTGMQQKPMLLAKHSPSRCVIAAWKLALAKIPGGKEEGLHAVPNSAPGGPVLGGMQHTAPTTQPGTSGSFQVHQGHQ